MFAGYYDDAEANASRMRDGMYWSGDLGYADARGFCWFAGRAGEWLRVGGENLGTAPIEWNTSDPVWWRPYGRGHSVEYVVLDAEQATSAGILPAD
jgi:hypothetical protein